MILAALGPATAYRLHTPQWATMPTSGAGAAAVGGRANRIGVPALYLALEAETAIAEYQQLSSLMPPATLVNYTVKVDPVVDFRGGFDGDADDFLDWLDSQTEGPSMLEGTAEAQGELDSLLVVPADVGVQGGNELFDAGGHPVARVEPLDLQPSEEAFTRRVVWRVAFA